MKIDQLEIFHINAPHGEAMGGDVDYARKLVETLGTQGLRAHHLLTVPGEAIPSAGGLQKTSKDIAHTNNTIPGIHLHLRPPYGGTVFSPRQLRQFPCVVVTVHEFRHLTKEHHRRLALHYIHAADHVIFTCPSERDAVAQHKPNIYSKSSIIPVFPTIPACTHTESGFRCNDIVNFGLLRSGRGLNDVLQLAQLIKTDPHMKALRDADPKRNDIKIILAGRLTNPVVLGYLVRSIYGIPKAEMPARTGSLLADNLAIITFYNNHVRGKIPRVLPIELRLNVPEEELQKVFGRCTFAYMPIERGVTAHSSAAASVIASGCICIGKINQDTPDDLRKGGMIEANSPREALDAIITCIEHPSLASKITDSAGQYIQRASLENSAREYVTAYKFAIDAALSRGQRAPLSGRPASSAMYL